MNTTKKISIFSMVLIAMMTAVLCILAPFSLPIPTSPVPISLATFAIYLSIYVLGWKKALVSCLVYLALGLIGMPVFSGFGSGPGKLLGPTGGYLWGYFGIILVAGLFIQAFPRNYFFCFLGLVLGTAVCYLFGTLWYAYQGNLSLGSAVLAAVVPFLPGDFFKIAVALFVGPKLRGALKKLS